MNQTGISVSIPFDAIKSENLVHERRYTYVSIPFDAIKREIGMFAELHDMCFNSI